MQRLLYAMLYSTAEVGAKWYKWPRIFRAKVVVAEGGGVAKRSVIFFFLSKVMIF